MKHMDHKQQTVFAWIMYGVAVSASVYGLYKIFQHITTSTIIL